MKISSILLIAKVIFLVSAAKVVAETIPLIPKSDLIWNVGITLISGFCGGMLRVHHAGEKWWPKGLTTAMSGGIVAVFLWPIGEPFIQEIVVIQSMEATQKMMFGGFVVGLVGIGIVGFFLDFVSIRRTRILGGKEHEHDGK